MSPWNNVAPQNMAHMLVTDDTFHLEISPVNDEACQNIAFMSRTLDTSHLEMSPLNDIEFMKIEDISVTLDTSQSSIGPYAASEQCRSRDDFKQLSTALLSCALDCGENTISPAQESGDMKSRRAKKMV